MPKKKTETDLQPWEPIQNYSRDQILTWLFNREDLKKIIGKIAKTRYLQEELSSELFLWLCKKEEAELQRLYQEKVIDFVILKWINLQWNSSTSPFYNRIKKFEIGKAMSEEQAIKVRQALYGQENQVSHLYAEALDKALNELISPGEYTFYHRDIVKAKLALGTIKAVSEKFGIRPEYISQALKDGQAMLKEIISADVQAYLENQIKDC